MGSQRIMDQSHSYHSTQRSEPLVCSLRSVASHGKTVMRECVHLRCTFPLSSYATGVRLTRANENIGPHSTPKRAKKRLVRAPEPVLHPLDEGSGPVLPSRPSGMGYLGEGSHVGDASWRQRSSCRAVGRVVDDLFQQRSTNPHRASERPKDLALDGFSGRFPF